MNDNVLRELLTLDNVQVALEGAVTLPADAQQLLAIFSPTGTGVSNEADYDNGGPGALQKVSARVKELIAATIKWIRERIADFAKWAKEAMLGLDAAKQDVEKMRGLLQSHPAFKTEDILLSPMVTGALAVEGVLDETLPTKMVRLRDVLATLIDTRNDMVRLADSASEYLESVVKQASNYSALGEKVAEEYAKVAQNVARHLKTVDDKRSFVGVRKFTQTSASNQFSHVDRVQDLASLPLPGGYALVASYVHAQSRSIFGQDLRPTDALKTVAFLLESLSPNLVKLEDEKISFKGKALDGRGAHVLVEESDAILSAVEKAQKPDGGEKVARALEATLKKLGEDAEKTLNSTQVVNLVRTTIKLLDSDRYATFRYAIKTVRAAMRYIAASVDRPAEAREAIPAESRLSAPAA